MGELTISMAIFNSYVSLPEGISYQQASNEIFEASWGDRTWNPSDSHMMCFNHDKGPLSMAFPKNIHAPNFTGGVTHLS